MFVGYLAEIDVNAILGVDRPLSLEDFALDLHSRIIAQDGAQPQWITRLRRNPEQLDCQILVNRQRISEKGNPIDQEQCMAIVQLGDFC